MLLNYLVKTGGFDQSFIEFFNLEFSGILPQVFFFLFAFAIVAFARKFISDPYNYEKGMTSISSLEKQALESEKGILMLKLDAMRKENRMDNLFYRLCALAFVLLFLILFTDKVRDYLIVHWYILIPFSVLMSCLFLAGIEPDKNDYSKFYFDTGRSLKCD